MTKPYHTRELRDGLRGIATAIEAKTPITFWTATTVQSIRPLLGDRVRDLRGMAEDSRAESAAEHLKRYHQAVVDCLDGKDGDLDQFAIYLPSLLRRVADDLEVTP